MAAERVHTTAHHVNVAAPAGVVYELVAGAARWPLHLPHSVHVEQLDFDGRSERLRMWATDGGQVTSWTSHRRRFPRSRRITFRRQAPDAYGARLLGTWIVEAAGARRSRLTLLHDVVVEGGGPACAARALHGADRAGRADLDALSRIAERCSRLDELTLLFEESVRVRGGAELVYDFLYRAADWPGRIPHVSRSDVTEAEPGVQVLSMDTTTADGCTHTTESVRVCFPHAGRIVHKQTLTPALLTAHTGEWSVVPDASGVTASALHSVVLREENIEAVLGPGATVADARRHVRAWLGRDSLATLELAKRHAGALVRML
ncbi:aromatase/cyclase [Streptomyces sp. NPDC089424]|uniref:aromatase/cyclase n=1 Tax=Streptomyces sp. NPDC089424 TaxID=3365917 RepID=UPI0037FB31D8